MKLVRNIADRELTVDTDWVINAVYADGVVTISVRTSETNDSGEHVFLDTTAKFVLSDLQPQITDCSMFAMLADIHESSVGLYKQHPIDYKPTCTKSTIVDAFGFTKESKISFNDVNCVFNLMPYAALIVPYANSTPDEMIFMVRTPLNVNVKFTSSGFSPEMSPVDADSMYSLFPSLRSLVQSILAPVGVDTAFTLQSPNKRPNVTIYLESTGGILTNKRIVTDSTGTATGYIRPIDNTPIRVKAGFKNYVNFLDIPVNTY